MSNKIKILVLFGTRPEAIKLAPVVGELKKRAAFATCVVSSGQHADLLAPFLRIFGVETDYDLRAMTENQTPNRVCAKILHDLDEIFDAEKPDCVLVQGDTTTAFAGAFAAFNRRIAVGHVEAGLRSGDAQSPFPEEMYRRLISQTATFHFAATAGNRAALRRERVGERRIFPTGNTIVDALKFIGENFEACDGVKDLIEKTAGYERILLTTHRRESHGAKLSRNLRELRDFVESRPNTCLIFPVHPNPNVRRASREILSARERVFLLEPLDYVDFVCLMKAARLIVSDSGGVQEEAPSLGKPVLILRDVTERPEAVEAGIARLVGKNSLRRMLEEAFDGGADGWLNSLKTTDNPFGDGKAAKRIVAVLEKSFLEPKPSGAAAKIRTPANEPAPLFPLVA